MERNIIFIQYYRQTLYSIAKAYSVSVDDIVKDNPEVKSVPIYPGQKLKIAVNNQQFTVSNPSQVIAQKRFINNSYCKKKRDIIQSFKKI